MNNKKRPMSDQEIVREYLAAKEPGKQICILADENLCTPETIRNILRREGIPLGRKDPEPKPELAPTISRDIPLSMLVRHAAVDAIAELLAMADGRSDKESASWEFREQVRGVLRMIHVLERIDQDEPEE